MKLRVNSRSALTLIELLVVISIIALLAAISVSAVFRLMESQRETNTNKHLLKIQIGFEQQWKAQSTRSRPVPTPSDLTMKPDGSRTPRAKALHETRLRQEFPDLAEVRTNVFVGRFPAERHVRRSDLLARLRGPRDAVTEAPLLVVLRRIACQLQLKRPGRSARSISAVVDVPCWGTRDRPIYARWATMRGMLHNESNNRRSSERYRTR